MELKRNWVAIESFQRIKINCDSYLEQKSSNDRINKQKEIQKSLKRIEEIINLNLIAQNKFISN